jgi:hypothetical protein
MRAMPLYTPSGLAWSEHVARTHCATDLNLRIVPSYYDLEKVTREETVEQRMTMYDWNRDRVTDFVVALSNPLVPIVLASFLPIVILMRQQLHRPTSQPRR